MASWRFARLAVLALALLAFQAVTADAGWLITANTQVISLGDTGTVGGSVTVPSGSALGVVAQPVGATATFYATTSNNQIVQYNASTFAIVNGPTSGSPLPLSTVAPGTSNAGGGAGLALDATGNVYVANSGTSNSILRFTPTLSSDLKFNQNTFVTGVNYIDVAFDKAGNLYATANATTAGQGQIYKFTATGAPFDANNGLLASGFSQTIGGVTVGPDGNLYVANTGTNNVAKIDSTTGTVINGTFASGNGLNSPDGLAFGPDGNLYVANFNTGQVKEFNGTTGAFIGNFSPPTGAFTLGPRFISFSTPEPGSLSLVALGSIVGGIGYWRRRKAQPKEEAATAEPETTQSV